MAIVFVTMLGADAFHDLRSVANITVSDGGNMLNQTLFGGIGLIVALVISVYGAAALRPLASPSTILLLGWFLVTTALSSLPVPSARRLVMLLICVSAAACLFLVARSVRQLVGALTAAALVLVLASYVSLLVVPDLAIHSLYDVREPEHDGSWRGLFPHKNEAAAVMSIFLFLGLLAAKVVGPRMGYSLAILSAIFLVFTRSKAPIGMIPLVFIQSWLCQAWVGRWKRAAVLVGPLAVMLLLSVGTVYLPIAKTIAAQIMPDPSFTGRTQIWEFSRDAIARKPITGAGYGAFWGTETTFYGMPDVATWVNTVGDAHDGYMNTAVEIGIPGLILTLWWLVLEPLRDLQRCKDGPALDPINLFFLRWWAFGLLSSVLEGVFYHPTNGGFFIIVVAVFGLRFRTRATLRMV